MQKANSKHIRTAKNMSSANMAPIIMIIMIIMAGASWNEAVSFNDGAKKAEYISEEAAAEEDAALVLDRFRVLLGLKSFHKLKPGNAGASPSPSPSPAPVERLHVRPHHRRPHLYAVHPAAFDDEVVHLRNSLSMLEEACKELRSSRLFLKLLEAVLKTGNRMNVGTIRGGAKAFKLDALLKLADVKGTDGKTTLLHFVVQEIVRSEGIRMSESIIGKINLTGKNRTIEEKEEDYRRMGLDLVSGLSAELYNVKKTASIDLDVLASSVSNLCLRSASGK